MTMWMSPNKKRRGSVARSIEKVPSVGGAKIYPAIWPFKFGKARRSLEDGNKNNSGRRVTEYGWGNAGYGYGKGSRIRLVKSVASQPPGFPSGVCLGSGREEFCRCGKHNK